MKTNPVFSLSNFRSFLGRVDFELAPLTLLIGCNSAGKSSLVKALMLLAGNLTGRSVCSGIWNVYYEPSINLRASSWALKLGGFRNVVSTMSKEGTIELSYRMWSSFLNEEVVCKRTYSERRGVTSDGKLDCFSIEKINGKVICKASLEVFSDGFGNPYDSLVPEDFNFSGVEDNYNRFITAFGYRHFARCVSMCDKNSDYYVQVQEGLRKGQESLRKYNMSIDDANEFDKNTLQLFWDKLFPVEEDNMTRYLRENLAEEKKEDRKKDIYISCVINEIVSPWFIRDLSFVDSTTNKIDRVYNVEDNDKFSRLLCKLVNQANFDLYCTGDFVNKWLKEFGIGDKLVIEGTEEGYGVKIYVDNKGEKRLLADEGYGITQLASLLLQIDILKNKYRHEFFDGCKESVEYLPSFISIEEPEVHLHPKYQSMLADLFVEAYQEYNIHFLIETHSEYMIRKLQVLVADKECTLQPEDVSLNYVEKEENGASFNRQIIIRENGDLSEPFGAGFFDEADNLAIQLFREKPILL